MFKYSKMYKTYTINNKYLSIYIHIYKNTQNIYKTFTEDKHKYQYEFVYIGVPFLLPVLYNPREEALAKAKAQAEATLTSKGQLP